MNILSTKLHTSICLICLFLAMSVKSLEAQSLDPEFRLNNQEACLNGDFSLPVTVNNFNLLTSFQYTITWDAQMVSFDTVSFSNPTLGANLLFGTNMVDDGVLTVSWFDQNVTGVSLTDSTTIFTLDFTSLGTNLSASDISFENVPTMKEVSAFVDNDIIIVNAVYHDGVIGVAQPDLESVMITNDVDNANIGAVDITVSSGTAPYSYFWSNGADTEDLASVGTGVYSVDVTDAKGCQSYFGEFTVDNILDIKALESLESINIYPNPSDRFVHLDARFTNDQEVEIAIYNILGKKVYSVINDNMVFSTDIDVSGLSTGSYLLVLQAEEGIHTEKIEIVR